MSEVLREDFHLTKSLIQARQALVGGAPNLAKRIDEQLVEAFGFKLPWQFYHASSSENVEDKVKWAKVGRDLLIEHIKEDFLEIEQQEEPVF